MWPACLVALKPRWAERLVVAAALLFPWMRVAAHFGLFVGHGQLALIQITDTYPILWGVTTAFVCRRGWLQSLEGRKFRLAVPLLSAALLFVVGPFVWSKHQWFSNLTTTALECVAIVLLLLWLLSGSGGLLRRALEFPLVVQLGLLSYSIYLWQGLLIYWDRLATLLLRQ